MSGTIVKNGLLFETDTGRLIGTVDQNGVERRSVGSQETLVASRCCLPTSFTTGNKEMIGRTKHWAFDNLTQLVVGYWNGYLNNTGVNENSNTAQASYQFQIESIDGVILGMGSFNGALTGVAQPGAVIISDKIKLSQVIPKGRAFYVTTWFSCQSGGIVFGVYNGSLNTASGAVSESGEFLKFSATTVTNTIGTVVNSSSTTNNNTHRPAFIAGLTSTESYIVFGDSRNSSSGITGAFYGVPADGFGLSGEIGNLVRQKAAYLNASYSGAFAANDAVNMVARLVIAQYCTRVIFATGINDSRASAGNKTAAQMLTTYKALAALFPSHKKYLITLPPSTTADNTTTDANDAQRAVNNNNVRSIPLGFDGYIEVADVLESQRDSGFWAGPVRTTAADGNITSAGTTLTSASAAFTASDLNRYIIIPGAGAAGATLVTNITAVTNSTTVTVGNAASTTVTTAAVKIGIPSMDGIHESIDGGALLRNAKTPEIFYT